MSISHGDASLFFLSKREMRRRGISRPGCGSFAACADDQFAQRVLCPVPVVVVPHPLKREEVHVLGRTERDETRQLLPRETLNTEMPSTGRGMRGCGMMMC